MLLNISFVIFIRLSVALAISFWYLEVNLDINILIKEAKNRTPKPARNAAWTKTAMKTIENIKT